jgi:hypothetical protein
MLIKAHAQGRLNFFADHAALTDRRAFKRFLAPLRKIEWVVYTKNPFAGPKQVLRYLSRYTHRVAISNRRLVSTDDNRIAFRWKDYRIDGPDRWKTMTLHPHEFNETALRRMRCSKMRRRIAGSYSSQQDRLRMVRLSAFAVFRLMTSSNVVDCITGRSAGLVPLKTRPA